MWRIILASIVLGPENWSVQAHCTSSNWKSCSSTSCTIDRDCRPYPFSACLKGVCYTVKNKCKTDNDCPFAPEFQCVEEQCVRLGQTCQNSKECPPSKEIRCIDNTCSKYQQCTVAQSSNSQYVWEPKCQELYRSCMISCSNDLHCRAPEAFCINSTCKKLGQPCKNNEQCFSIPNTACVSGKCIKIASDCLGDSDCPDNSMRCVKSHCIPDGAENPIHVNSPCVMDQDCMPSQNIFCIGSACTKLPQHCDSNNDCSSYSNAACVYGKCAKVPQFCSHHSHCPKRFRCIFGMCTPVGAKCTSSKDCISPIGVGCVDGICKEFKKCDALQCPFSHDCITGFCVPRSTSCTTDFQCPHPRMKCHDSACVLPPPDKTNDGKFCTKDENCLPKENVFCIKSFCKRIPEKCLSNEDCPDRPSVSCINRKCVKNPQVCQHNGQCPTQFQCKSGVCTPDRAPCERNDHCVLSPSIGCVDQVCIRLERCQRGKCPTSHICIDNFCHPSSQRCRFDQQCSHPKMKCEQWLCKYQSAGPLTSVPSGMRCVTDQDCAPSQNNFCISSTCTNLPEQCYSNHDCSRYLNTACIYGKCSKVPQLCSRHSHCPKHFRCVFRTCTPLGAKCTSNKDCISPVGVGCVGGTCKKFKKCDKVQCPSSHECIGRFCIPKSTCTTDEQCAHPRMKCYDSACVLPRPDKTNDGKLCTGDEDCLPKENVFCIESYCRRLPEYCRSNRECSIWRGVSCINRKCVKNPQACLHDGQCPNQFRCKSGTCTPDRATCKRNDQCISSPSVGCVDQVCTPLERCQSGRCPNSQICVDSFCHPSSQSCRIDKQCSHPSMRCVRGLCKVLPKVSRTCYDDQDCEPSQNIFCINSSCMQIKKDCRINRDCSSYPSMVCVHGKCTKVGQSCTADSQCPKNVPCVYEKCTPVGDRCDRYSHCYPSDAVSCIRSVCVRLKKCQLGRCPHSDVCIDNFCVPAFERCEIDQDCPHKKMKCVRSRCTHQPHEDANLENKPCVTNEDCSVAQKLFCINSFCRKLQKTCRDKQDCPPAPNMDCVNGLCTIIPEQYCESDKQCHRQAQCVDNSCKKAFQPCTRDQECPDRRMKCKTSYCVYPGKGVLIPEQFCEHDNQCPRQDQCVDNSCKKAFQPCTRDQECPDRRMKCKTSYCVYPGKGVLIPEQFCESDKQCHRQAQCVDNSCKEAYQRCKYDQDCPDRRMKCKTSYCIYPRTSSPVPPQTCNRDKDCEGIFRGNKKERRVCVDGKCRSVGNKCTSKKDCGSSPSIQCLCGICSRVQKCVRGAHFTCPPKFLCIDSVCIPDGQPCRNDRDCPHPKFKCVGEGKSTYPSKKCIYKPILSITPESDKCIFDRECQGFPNNVCLMGFCTRVGQECNADPDCWRLPGIRGLRCYNGRCDKQQCYSKEDCTTQDDEGCVEGRCARLKPCNCNRSCPENFSCVKGYCQETSQYDWDRSTATSKGS